MDGIGAILKRIRLERHITLEEIEDVTKIRSKYLQAIENEQFELLPGTIYTKGFINTYIRFLDIGDMPEIIEIMQKTKKTVVPAAEVEAEEIRQDLLSGNTTAAPIHIEDKPITSKRYLIIGISVVAIVALFFIQTLYNRQQPPDDELILPPNIVDEDQKDDDNVTSQLPAEDVTPEYTGLNIQLQIIDSNPSLVDKCWTTVNADGESVFTETLSEGAAKSITADETIHIRVGNGGVAKLTLNGKDLGVMGEAGQVVERTFTLEDINN